MGKVMTTQSPRDAAGNVDESVWSEWRRHFPVLERKTYLNSGSYGALSREVDDALQRYLHDRHTLGADWEMWVAKAEALRSSIARLLNAAADEVAVTASASAGINSLASSLSFSGARRRVVVSDFEFPTNAQIWHAQESRGAQVVHVPENQEGSIPLEHFERAIDERTLLVAVTHVCYRNGVKLDIPGIVEIARRRGALVLVDAFQSAGTMPLDVRGLDVDFLVGGTFKYLLGTAGVGYLYVRDALIRELTPTATGWFAQADIGAMDITRNEPSPTARRFEAGTPPMPNCYAALAGLEIIQQIGVEAIERRIRQIATSMKERLLAIGAKLATPLDANQHGATIAIRSRNAEQLVERLSGDGIVSSSRDGNVRTSPHFYNNLEDVESLIVSLQRHHELLA
jgi:selenocysteine lyase/cysteine desulfurase